MRVETAIKMIENHGHKAFVTAEGLACVMEAVQSTPMTQAHEIALVDDDCVFEEVTTFPLKFAHWTATGEEAHYVDNRALRNWLGY